MHRMVHFSFVAHSFMGRDVQPHADATTTALPPAAAESTSAIPSAVWDALFYGFLSGLSFPLGSMVGIALSPVSPYVVALIVAFGAGALLFAVTVELYGEQLKHLEEHNHHQEGVVEVSVCLVMAFVGAMVYIALNRYVESLAEGPEKESEKEASDKQSASGVASGVDMERGGRGAQQESASTSSPEATPRDRE